MVLGSGIRDPGSGKNIFRILDPGVKKAPDPGSPIRIRNTGYTKWDDLKCQIAPFSNLGKGRFPNFNNLGQILKNYRTFYQTNCQEALKNMVLGSWIRDPGSGKNLFRILDPGVKKAPDP